MLIAMPKDRNRPLPPTPPNRPVPPPPAQRRLHTANDKQVYQKAHEEVEKSAVIVHVVNMAKIFLMEWKASGIPDGALAAYREVQFQLEKNQASVSNKATPTSGGIASYPVRFFNITVPTQGLQQNNTQGEKERLSLEVLKFFNLNPIFITVPTNDSSLNLLEKDPLILQQIVDEAQKKAKTIARNLLPQISALVDDYSRRGGDNKKAFSETLQKMFISECEKQEFEQITDSLTKDYQKSKKGYRQYRKKMTRKVVLSGVGTAASTVGLVVTLATTPLTGGATIAGVALSFIGLIKAIGALLKTIGDLAADAEAIEKRVYSAIWSYDRSSPVYDQSKVGTLPAVTPDLSKGKRIAGEVGSTLLTSTVGDVATGVGSTLFAGKKTSAKGNVGYHRALTNIKQISEDCDLWKHKLSGLKVKAHELAIQLNRLLEKIDHVEKELENNTQYRSIVKNLAQKVHNNITVRQALGDLQKQHQSFRKWNVLKIRARVDEILSRIPALVERVNVGQKRREAAENWLKAVKSTESVHLKRFENVTPTVTNLTLTVASAGLSVGSLTTEVPELTAKAEEIAKYVYDWVETARGLGMDIGSEVHDLKADVVY